ncbi:MAG: metal-dependent transcriptional regulator [Euryarchaeota archaeon]|nr:metal-dependent transcriptional regulator [Euryarchaeota archaeon]
MPALGAYSENVEMYLKTIFLLAKEGEGRAKTGDISRELPVSPSSVTEMLDKLQKEGFVRHAKYQGATLTREGDAYARRILRKHCVIERFMVTTLHYPKGRFHDEACKMEHVVTDETERRLRKLVGQPDTCPDCYDLRKHYCSLLFAR